MVDVSLLRSDTVLSCSVGNFGFRSRRKLFSAQLWPSSICAYNTCSHPSQPTPYKFPTRQQTHRNSVIIMQLARLSPVMKRASAMTLSLARPCLSLPALRLVRTQATEGAAALPALHTGNGAPGVLPSLCIQYRSVVAVRSEVGEILRSLGSRLHASSCATSSR